MVLALTTGLPLGCQPNPSPGDGDGSSGETSTSSSTGPSMTSLDGVDTTVGLTSQTGSTTMLPATDSSGSSSSETTRGDSTTDGSTTDGTTSSGSTDSGSTDSGSTSSGTTSSGSTDSGTTSSGSTDSGSTDSGSTDTGGVMVPDITGDFLLALATPLDPSLPLQYIATFDFTPGGMGGTVDVELQPLALDAGSTTIPRTFFGAPMMFAAIPVAADGSFTIDVGMMAVAAETNPIIFIDAQADMVVFDAQILDQDNVCGTVSGNVVFPIMASLAGSTFAAVRVADTLPASLPVVFPMACP
jgi:hypothetical protein